MSRPTITRDDELDRARKAMGARQGRSIASIIKERLRLHGVADQPNTRPGQ